MVWRLSERSDPAPGFFRMHHRALPFRGGLYDLDRLSGRAAEPQAGRHRGDPHAPHVPKSLLDRDVPLWPRDPVESRAAPGAVDRELPRLRASRKPSGPSTRSRRGPKPI